MGSYVYGASKKTVQTTTGETVRLYRYLYKPSIHGDYDVYDRLERYSRSVMVQNNELVVLCDTKADMDKYATMDRGLEVYRNKNGGTINYGFDNADPVGYLVKRGDRYELVEVATMLNYHEEKRWA